MRCSDVARLSSQYLDGELHERQSSALRGHLRVCEPCAELVADEARIQELASALEPVEPPSALWESINARLAEEEIADGQRPRLFLWVASVIDGLRRRAVPALVVTTAVAALLLVWVQRSRHPEQAAQVRTTAPQSPAAVAELGALAAEGPCAGADTHNGYQLCEIEQSDQRYLSAIDELRAQLLVERTEWPTEAARQFDFRLAKLEEAAVMEKARMVASEVADPAVRDPLHRIYRQQIDLLGDAVLMGSPGALE